MKRINASAILLTLATSMTLSGCATTGGLSGTPGTPGAKKCNPWAVGAVGAVLGAALGASRDSKTAVRGAVAGATIGALSCLIINTNSRKTQTADAVNAKYRRANGGVLPSSPTVISYSTSISPGSKVMAGQTVEVKSNLSIADGTWQHISSISEDMVLLDTAGKEIKRVRKDVDGSQAGGYENTFTFSFPKGVSQGVYGVRTELLVNGKVAGHNDENVQLVVEYRPTAYRLAVL